ncbi:MAG: tRNA (adenosine(37)-N6)-dimethylallyltransferase MiaA [Steroidobacteraceae bacterium]
MGPTGAGKSDLALALVEELALEIVSVDSSMVYRGLDIGTAKPSLPVRSRITHHLIDLLDPAESYSAGRFVRDALAAMQDIRSRGRVPLLVGGTMLYFHALLDGLADLPTADEDFRRELDERAEREGWPALHAELARLDPVAAERIDPGDAQRIQRALEVIQATGSPLSELQTARQPFVERASTLRIVLAPAVREVLHGRLETRLSSMMQQGFLEEVERLHARANLDAGKPAMRSVGYRQLWDYLDGRSSLDEAVYRVLVATRQLAKRQMTWLRQHRDANWFDPLESQSAGHITRLVREALA